MQPVQRILVATDLSELSGAAVRAALDHARSWGAELRVLHVAASRQAQPEAADALLGLVAELGGEVHIVPHVRVGSAAEEIVRCAEEDDAQLIVVGRHGHTGITGLLLGSVAERDRLVSLAAEDDVWLRPSEAPADDSLGHRAYEGGRSAVVGCIKPVEKTGRYQMR
ncbi:universal stress protein [Sorangium sp. So ce260]|uniref:universal stress protein n=1 Tax=Sorangium sp. So ce260 TaxID=3133291 RepID=UPI003F60FA1E